MPKIQRRWVIGKLYTVEGKRNRVRKLLLIGRAKIEGKEVLLFRPQRKANKTRS